MSAGLTSEAQLRYLLQWFAEFSELQREDFLPVLAAAKSGKPDLLADALAKLSCNDKPISLFQCRIKLFNEWYPSWAEEEQDRLVKGVSETDPEFGSKLQELIANGPMPNGDSETMNGYHTPEIETTEQPEPVQIRVEVIAPEDTEDILNEEHVNITQDNIPVEIAASS